MMRKSWLLAAMLLLVGLLAACGSDDEQGTAATPGDAPTGPATEAAIETEAAGELIVYSGRSEALVQPIIDRFEAESGIDVQVRYGSTAELAATLLEEGDRSPADVFYAQDPGGLGAVDAAGLLGPLPAELLSQVPGRFASPDGTWVGISGRARTVVYNTERVPADELPADLWGFTEAAWQGRVGWAPANGSFQAMVTAMRALWGEDQTREWLGAMQANGAEAYDNNSSIVNAVGAGEVDAGLVNHYYVFRFIEEQGESFPARNYFLPAGGPGSVILVSGAGVLANAPNADNARRFIAFLLSAEAQQYFADETFEYPVIDGIETSPLLTPLAELDAVAADVAPEQMADLPGTVALLSELGILP